MDTDGSRELTEPLIGSDDDDAFHDASEDHRHDDGVGYSTSSHTSLSDEELQDVCKRTADAAKIAGHDAAIDMAFDALDISATGVLNRRDIEAFMEAAARHIKLDVQDVNGSLIAAAVDALVWDARHMDETYAPRASESLAPESDDHLITRDQFRAIFDRHPDMLSVFEDLDASLARRRSATKLEAMLAATGEEAEIEAEEDEQAWHHEAVTHWKNKWVALLWTLIYVGGNVAAFTEKAIHYSKHDEAQAVFGNCIVVARGCAACLNLNACLVLLAMCKHFATLLRKTPLRFVFPFDAIQEAHIMIGIVFGLLAASHTFAHICDFHRLGRADEDDIHALLGHAIDPIPTSYAGRWGRMLRTRAGITGIIMVVCIVVAYSFAFNRREKFNRFWYTHHLLIVMLIALCVHGTQKLLEPYQSLYWVIGPLALYVIPRLFRETPLSSLKVEKVEVKKGDVVQLQLKKPWYYRGYVQSGMYGVLNVPNVSRLEWHPFTFTSAPCDDYIEFHFRKVGRWTGQVHDMLEERSDPREPTGIKDPPVVKVEGPIGASSQGFSDHSVVVLVGAGIGVTPMISVLKQLLASPGKLKRCFFYWTTRDRDSFLWFASLLDEIYEADRKHLLQVRHFLTSVRHDGRDLGAVLLHHATRAHHRRTDVDLLLGRQAHHQVEVGRPDWLEELDSVREEALSLGQNSCKIFFCGSTRMGQAIAKASTTVSLRSADFHMYFSKETF